MSARDTVMTVRERERCASSQMHLNGIIENMNFPKFEVSQLFAIFKRVGDMTPEIRISSVSVQVSVVLSNTTVLFPGP